MVLPLSGSENESQRWPRKRKDSFFFIPVHSRGIWNGHQLQNSSEKYIHRWSFPQLPFSWAGSTTSHCSLCGLGSCCQVRLSQKRTLAPTSSDSSKQRSKTLYAYSFKQEPCRNILKFYMPVSHLNALNECRNKTTWKKLQIMLWPSSHSSCRINPRLLRRWDCRISFTDHLFRWNTRRPFHILRKLSIDKNIQEWLIIISLTRPIPRHHLRKMFNQMNRNQRLS